MRLAKPVYEGLPLLYVLAGMLLLGLSYHLRAGVLSGLSALIGLAGLIGGGAVWLRRRNYRAASAEYVLRSTAQPIVEPEADEAEE